MKKIFLITLLFSLGVIFAKAQGIGYDITYSTPMIFNPALAGTSEGPRNIVAYGLDHFKSETGTTNYYNVFYASYDQYVEKAMGGLGLVFQNSSSATGNYNKFYAGLAYAPTILIKDKMTFKPVVQLCYGRNSIPNSTTATMAGDSILSSTANFFDLNAGFFAYCERLYGGLMVKHITQPNLSNFSNVVRKSPIVYSAAFGGVIGDISEEEGFKFSPNLVYDFASETGSEKKLTYCADFKYKLAKVGVHYEDNVNKPEGRYNILAGIEVPRFSVVYSYSVNSENADKSVNTKHQVGIIYKVKAKKEHEKVKKLNLVDL
ncbi:MAG: PorP/SprF family type IX secretion system membrane protein [Bacteroidetes bacterium]|nr:PorP/SprF family type IX secretion system membrane protein [Bacteroidota bacterium]